MGSSPRMVCDPSLGQRGAAKGKGSGRVAAAGGRCFRLGNGPPVCGWYNSNPIWVAKPLSYGYYGTVKTTLDIQDELLTRAKRHAHETGRTLRAVVEEGLRQVLATTPSKPRYRLPDRSVGRTGAGDPLEAYSWQDLRDIIYNEDESE